MPLFKPNEIPLQTIDTSLPNSPSSPTLSPVDFELEDDTPKTTRITTALNISKTIIGAGIASFLFNPSLQLHMLCSDLASILG